MEKVDYLKLAEQYASFLVAIGGGSITTLAIVLSFGLRRPVKSLTDLQKNSRTYLIAALIVATISCFIGAHMMAESAAFISYSRNETVACKEKETDEFCIGKPIAEYKKANWGERHFLLASTNIFVGAFLMLFALMQIPAIYNEEKDNEITRASRWLCVIIGAGILLLMGFVLYFRLPESNLYYPLKAALVASFGYFEALYQIKKKWILSFTFIPTVILQVLLVLIFAWYFNIGGAASFLDIFLCSLLPLICLASLVFTGLRLNKKEDLDKRDFNKKLKIRRTRAKARKHH